MSGCSEEALAFFEELIHQYSAFPSPGADPWMASVDGTERYAKLFSRAQQERDAYRQQYLALRRA
jgi:hypothetical protein